MYEYIGRKRKEIIMTTYIQADQFFYPHGIRKGGYLEIVDGKFGKHVDQLPEGATVLDYTGYSIAPGLIDTKMNSNLTTDEINNLVMDFPISRIGTPDDVADLVLYLEHASYVTGQVIQVNGGWNI